MVSRVLGKLVWVGTPRDLQGWNHQPCSAPRQGLGVSRCGNSRQLVGEDVQALRCVVPLDPAHTQPSGSPGSLPCPMSHRRPGLTPLTVEDTNQLLVARTRTQVDVFCPTQRASRGQRGVLGGTTRSRGGGDEPQPRCDPQASPAAALRCPPSHHRRRISGTWRRSRLAETPAGQVSKRNLPRGPAQKRVYLRLLHSRLCAAPTTAARPRGPTCPWLSAHFCPPQPLPPFSPGLVADTFWAVRAAQTPISTCLSG